MSADERDPLVDLEKHRVQLEDNVAKLRKALRHWETWELEYETLKEEIERFKGETTAEDMLEIGDSLGGDLVNAKEMEELLGKNRQIKRNGSEVIGVISNRADYVRRNIEAVRNQLTAAERKLNAAEVLLEPDMNTEEGLPLTDIQEELDEEGNIISTTLSHPSRAAPDLAHTLKKAGVTEINEEGKIEKPTNTIATPSARTNDLISGAEPEREAASISKKAAGKMPKKSVSFTEDTKENLTPSESSGLESKGFNEGLSALTFNKGQKVIEVDEHDDEVASYPIIPTNESPEDGALRKQMLAFGLNEVGSVVAEINLDARGQEYSDDDEFDEFDSDNDGDEEEDEDKYGRTTNQVLTDKYKQQMLELEKKWNARMVENLGPKSDTNSLADYAEDARRLVVQKEEPEDIFVASAKETKPKKGVRFADDLEISPTPPSNEPKTEPPQPQRPAKPTISDTIVEHKAPSSTSSAAAPPPKPAKVSRFKSARVGASANIQPTQQPVQPYFISGPKSKPVPEGPPGKTLASNILERDVNEADVTPPEQEGLDPNTIAQEVAVEYNTVRNKMIQEQGGFLSNEYEPEEPVVEERDGKTKKVSRFKAARLGRDGL